MPIDLDGGTAATARPLWFRLDDVDAGPEMVATAELIRTSQTDREGQLLRQARLFANQWLTSLYDLATPRMDRRIGPWNLVAAAVSTAQSMVCRSGVNVTLETSGAEHSTQRLARDSTRWLYGVWGENKVSAAIAPDCFADAGILDVGVAFVRVVKKRIKIERALANEVIVSDIEALYGKPHQIFLKRYFPKHSVLATYGKDEASKLAIQGIATESPCKGMSYAAQMIPVYEGWAMDGKHLVAVKGHTLEAEKWDHDFLPAVPMYVDRPFAGWYGRGYAQQLMGYQIQLLQINDAIDEHVMLLAAAKWIHEVGDGIDPTELNNEIGGVLTKNRGAADPHILADTVVPKDLLEERQRIFDQGLGDIGLNSWSVKGQEPAERSGVAMEVSRDKERGRLLTAGTNYEQWHVDLAYICFALGDQTSGEEFAGRGPADKDLQAVDFKTIAKFLKDAPWRVKPFPISALPESPDARRKTVEGWLESGLVTGPVALSLLDLPDVDAEASMMSAAREDIMWCIEEILEKGRPGYRSPEALQDLDLGKRMFVSAWLKARRQGVIEERLDLLAKWISEAQALQAPPAAVPTEVRPGVGTAPTMVAPVQVGPGAPPPGPAAPPDPGAPPVAAPPVAAPPVGAPSA